MEKTNRKGGVRAGAGRKGFKDESLAKQLVSLGGEICIKALKREGEFADIETSVLLDLARTFAVKSIPNKIEGEMVSNIINIVRYSETKKPQRVSVG